MLNEENTLNSPITWFFQGLVVILFDTKCTFFTVSHYVLHRVGIQTRDTLCMHVCLAKCIRIITSSSPLASLPSYGNVMRGWVKHGVCLEFSVKKKKKKENVSSSVYKKPCHVLLSLKLKNIIKTFVVKQLYFFSQRAHYLYIWSNRLWNSNRWRWSKFLYNVNIKSRRNVLSKFLSPQFLSD